MKKLTAKELTVIRNVIIAVSMIGGFIVWLALPDVIKNSNVIHVGTGKFGYKWGALIVLLFPLFALIPDTNREEIHTEDPAERAVLLEESLRLERKKQIAAAIFVILAIILGDILWVMNAA